MHLHRRWWWLVGLVFPNLERRHHLIEQADRARRCDLKWYGLPPEAPAARRLGGMAGVMSKQSKYEVVRASSTTLLHEQNGATLQVTVQRSGGHPGGEPLARLALPPVRNRDGLRDPRWAARTVEEFHQAQQHALADVTRQPLDVRIDGLVHEGEAVEDLDPYIAGSRQAAKSR